MIFVSRRGARGGRRPQCHPRLWDVGVRCVRCTLYYLGRGAAGRDRDLRAVSVYGARGRETCALWLCVVQPNSGRS
eukprot:6133184-Prymnesium_polylepis.1